MSDTAEIFHFPTQERRPRVNSWRWNEIEDEALLALPPEIERLYLHGIRKHMDYASGITGRKRRVSMDMFHELLDYYPPAGSREKPRLYSRQQITRMLDKLEDVGLIARLHRGKGVKAPMEFSLPMACCDAEQHRAESEQAGASQENPHYRAYGVGNSEQGASKEDRSTSGHPVTPNPLTTFGGGASDELDLEQPPAEPKAKPKAKPSGYPEAFEQAWAAYPKRAGANPKRSAFKAWSARIGEGVTAESLQAGVDRYAAFIRAKGDERSEFVMQGQRFFGPNGEFENDWTAPATRQPGRQDGRKGFAQPLPTGSYTPQDTTNVPNWMRDIT